MKEIRECIILINVLKTLGEASRAWKGGDESRECKRIFNEYGMDLWGL